MTRCVIKFKDGDHCNLEADSIIVTGEGYIQIWCGEHKLVGIFFLAEIKAVYLTEKKG